ncbi:MAG TPA: serine/threonine-protein kinase [Ktedonobacteraceae bacterium]|jgi:serine/threonine protein kinase|nr:serine/threonine-protein kinase [Ktedonobacteraceae bacterium]
MNSTYHTHQRFGDYQLLHLLGQGGFTEVYLGEHVTTGQKVAVKLLDARQGGNELDKFFARASVLSYLQHPNIIQVFDSGISDYTAYLTMSYASGGNLRQRYPKGSRLPLPTIIHYVKQIASALQYVHQNQLIHRDIKPHNILLGDNETIMLSDFGIAVVTSNQDEEQPYFHDFEGTVIYAAPEQLQGKPRKNSDQYALAVTVYEWLTGSWPFIGNFDEIVQQHLYADPPLLREKESSVPPAVEQIVLRALEKEPEQRFSSIEAFAEALEQAVPQQPAPSLDLLVSSFQPPKRQFKAPIPFKK